MLPAKKLVIGIRPSKKMFRVRSTWGDVADAVIGALNHKKLGDDYYNKVGSNEARDMVVLSNPESGNLLKVDSDNVIFSANTYAGERRLNISKTLEEFDDVWGAVNSQLHVHDVRRIGIAGEARFYDISEPSKVLAEALTKTHIPKYTAKFHQTFEERLPEKDGKKPDFTKIKFLNIIRSFYDSSLDTDSPEDDCINANLDFQHYYSSLVTRNIFGEVKIHFRAFEERWRKFGDELKQLGLTD